MDDGPRATILIQPGIYFTGILIIRISFFKVSAVCRNKKQYFVIVNSTYAKI